MARPENQIRREVEETREQVEDALGTRETENRQELSAFLESPRVSFTLVGRETVGFYAGLFARLRARGRPIPTNDLWLAATALEHGRPWRPSV